MISKRKFKKILRKMIKSVPKELDLNKYVFCCSKEYDYGSKNYMGIDLHYFNIIESGKIYLIAKKDYNNLYI